MVRWFRRGTTVSAAPPASPPSPGSGAGPAAPGSPPPGGTGGSGFGGVGAGSGATERPPGSDTGARPRALPRLNLSGASPEEQRFTQVYAADRVGPMPYPNQASPDVAAARGRVRSLVNDLLPGGVDEGTGAALDPLIASWASGWLARIDSEHADHHAVVDRLVGGARRQLADAEASHERDRRALEIARRDYTDARERLLEPVEEPEVPEVPDRGTVPGVGGRSGSASGPAPGSAPGSASGSRHASDRPGGDERGPGGARRLLGRRRGRDEPADTGPPEPATGPMPLYRPPPRGADPDPPTPPSGLPDPGARR